MKSHNALDQNRTPRIDESPNRSLGEPVNLADRRYEQRVAQARRFLEGARSFGGNPPPFPAPPAAALAEPHREAVEERRTA
ncbi:MAG: hypothetical protein HZB55_11830 [Deltaproteobacteria bacterium]|nr:hypothetical protein [Deltaproteobacteria bacterium]